MQQSIVSLTINIVLLDSLIYSNRVEIACERRDAYMLSFEACILVAALNEHIIK